MWLALALGLEETDGAGSRRRCAAVKCSRCSAVTVAKCCTTLLAGILGLPAGEADFALEVGFRMTRRVTSFLSRFEAFSDISSYSES